MCYFADPPKDVELGHDGEGFEPKTVAPHELEGIPAGVDEECHDTSKRQEVFEVLKTVEFHAVGLHIGWTCTVQ